MEYYSAIKRNGVTPSVEMRMDLKTVIKNEVKSGREKQRLFPLSPFVKVTSGVLVCRPELLWQRAEAAPDLSSSLSLWRRQGMSPKGKRLKPHRSITSAAAKLLQSCLTLCDPIDGSPPGSSVPGILQAILEWVAISCSNVCMHAKAL